MTTIETKYAACLDAKQACTHKWIEVDPIPEHERAWLETHPPSLTTVYLDSSREGEAPFDLVCLLCKKVDLRARDQARVKKAWQAGRDAAQAAALKIRDAEIMRSGEGGE